MFFMAHLNAAKFAATPESEEVALLSEEEIPWDELAFAVVRRTLECFVSDRSSGEGYPMRHEVIRHPQRGKSKN